MFSQITFAWPERFSSLASSFNGVLSSAPGELSAAQGRLNNAPGLDYEHSPLASGASGSASDLATVIGDLLAQAQVVCAHPWSQGIGQGENHFRYLSPANAVQAAAKKCVDAADAHAPTATVDALVLVVSANGFNAFAQALQAFNQVFPVADFLFCQRRAQQLASVEQDKQYLPEAAINARWRARGIGALGLARPAGSALGELGASATAYEAGGVNADAELVQLASKKQLLLQAQQNAVAALPGLFSGGAGRAVFLQNKTATQINSALANSGLSHDEPLACCLLICAEPGGLTLLREMLSL